MLWLLGVYKNEL